MLNILAGAVALFSWTLPWSTEAQWHHLLDAALLAMAALNFAIGIKGMRT